MLEHDKGGRLDRRTQGAKSSSRLLHLRRHNALLHHVTLDSGCSSGTRGFSDGTLSGRNHHGPLLVLEAHILRRLSEAHLTFSRDRDAFHCPVHSVEETFVARSKDVLILQLSGSLAGGSGTRCAQAAHLGVDGQVVEVPLVYLGET